jgi:hypothetical protein
MTMKLAKVLVGCLALTMLLLAVSGNTAADVTSVAPNASHTEKLKVDSGELMVFWWSSTSDLHFVMKDPAGTTVVDVTDNSYSYDSSGFTAMGGTYTLKWTNDGTTSSILTFSSPFQDIGHTFDVLFWGVVIGGIVIVAVIVLVVVLSLTKKSKTPQPGMMPQVQPQYAAQVAATGKCPMCGMPVDPQGMFCAKCGARLR